MLSIVLLFLLAMAALGMFGRLKARSRCPRCGRRRAAKGRCACGRAW